MVCRRSLRELVTPCGRSGLIDVFIRI